MPYKHIQKTGKYPGRQYLVYTPSIPGEIKNPATLALFIDQDAGYKVQAAKEKAFKDAFTADLVADGWDGTPWLNVSADKVSVAQDDGKGASKKNLIPSDEIDLRKASAVLKTLATVPQA